MIPSELHEPGGWAGALISLQNPDLNAALNIIALCEGIPNPPVLPSRPLATTGVPMVTD
jgi:hypothetical protein